MEKQDVEQAFRWLLGRMPEEGLALADLLTLNEAELRDRILSSDEFKENYLNRYLSLFRFVFIRIPKTASTSVVDALASGGLASYNLSSEIPDLSNVFKTWRLVAGHFTYGDIVCRLYGIRPVYISVVREPVARIVSLYCQAFTEKDHPCHQEVISRTLYEALRYEGLFYEWTVNAQCRFLSGRHLLPDVMETLRGELFLIAGEKGIGRLLRIVCRMAGLPNVELPRLNASDRSMKQEVLAQPDYPEAERVIPWLTIEDRKLGERVGELFVSDPLREMLSRRVGIFE